MMGSGITGVDRSAQLRERLVDLRARAGGERVVFTTSFGLEDQALLDAVVVVGMPVELVTLDTGRLFPETYALWAETERRYGVRVRPFYPDAPAIGGFVARHGINAFRDAKQLRLDCCGIRKVEPLSRALAEADWWLTGLRGGRGAGGAVDPVIHDAGRGLWKAAPLHDWTRAEVAEYCARHDVPVSPLHARGFLSIGCEPCTRAVLPGEPERAGRWWWEDGAERECGLHVGPTGGCGGRRRADVALPPLEALEAESIAIIREIVAEARRPVLLYSVGKDSAVLLHLARKAFFPGPLPFACLHIASGWDFADLLALRDAEAARHGFDLVVHHEAGAAALGIDPFSVPVPTYVQAMLTDGLRNALDAGGYDAAFGGARRDEEKARAKERVVSIRSPGHGWDPKRQRPELWSLVNARVGPGETMRVFPLSNWTELDVWRYIEREDIPIVPLYLARPRPVVERDGMLIVVDDERMPLLPGETPAMRSVRFRTLGCYPLTGAIESEATTIAEVIAETLGAGTSERQGRAVDRDETASMERKKRQGYF